MLATNIMRPLRPAARAARLALRAHASTLADSDPWLTMQEIATQESGGKEPANSAIKAPPPPKTRSRSHKAKGKSTQDRAIRLFEEAVDPRAVPLPSPAPLASPSNLDASLFAGHLKQSRQHQDPAWKQYAYVVDRIIPALGWPGVAQSPLLRGAVAEVMSLVVAKKRRSWATVDDRLPKMTEICEASKFIGDERLRWQIGPLQSCLLLLVSQATGQVTGQATTTLTADQRAALLEDLVGVWEILMRRESSKREDEGALDEPISSTENPLDTSVSGEGESFSPGMPDKASPSSQSKMRQIRSAFSSLLPQISLREQANEGIIEALLTSYALLTDRTVTPSEVAKSSEDFVQAVAQILETLRLNSQQVSSLFNHRPRLKSYVLRRLFPASSPPASVAVPKLSGLKAKADERTAEMRRDLKAAFRVQNIRQIYPVWERIRGMAVESETTRDSLRKAPALLDYVVFIWCSLGKDKQLQETAALMAELGIPTTIRTLTAMLHGWKASKKWDHIERIWRTAMQGGAPLDAHIWTARISALMDGGRPEDGLLALKEMSDRWKDAPQTAVQPSIGVVNTVLAGLVRLGRLDAVTEVVEWAAREGIEPDIITFNTLLRPLLREGHYAEADRIFEMMKIQGVKPDEATFTIMSETSLGRLGAQTPKEQAAVLERIFAAMASAGLRANMKVYGKIIHSLLQSEGHTATAVKAVLAHIRERGWEPSPHIYTMLVEHYFARPEEFGVPAVKALIERRLAREETDTAHPSPSEEIDPEPSSSGVDVDTNNKGLVSDKGLGNYHSVDHTFWLRVMQGFSEAGEIDDSLRIFRRLASLGPPIGAHHCEPLLKMLISASRWEEAQEIVTTVAERQEEGRRRLGAVEDDGRRWRRYFWHLAKEHGLLDPQALGWIYVPQSLGGPSSPGR